MAKCEVQDLLKRDKEKNKDGNLINLPYVGVYQWSDALFLELYRCTAEGSFHWLASIYHEYVPDDQVIVALSYASLNCELEVVPSFFCSPSGVPGTS